MLNHCLEWDKWVLNDVTTDSGLTHLFNGRYGSVAYTLFVWPRLSAPVELSTRYTTPDTTVEIGSTSVTVQ